MAESGTGRPRSGVLAALFGTSAVLALVTAVVLPEVRGSAWEVPTGALLALGVIGALALAMPLWVIPALAGTDDQRASSLRAVYPDAVIATAAPYGGEVWRRLVVLGFANGEQPPRTATLVVRGDGIALWGGPPRNPLRHLHLPVERLHGIRSYEVEHERRTDPVIEFVLEADGALLSLQAEVYDPDRPGAVRLVAEELSQLASAASHVLDFDREEEETGLLLPEELERCRDEAWAWDPRSLGSLRGQVPDEYDALILAVVHNALAHDDRVIGEHLAAELAEGALDGAAVDAAADFAARIRAILAHG
ncbi:hypothetical protein [Homoserinibacter sp. YIM 151385]|uniref:hypothetical protein n=1 Tax=Homoserinibacter sp. YIM 151385 TaxID=2985506 RepID=UPI0022F004A9|nr:hypothetical protein [Homoserinibacter sp. YIM 151385]WBU38437.1 hypothetical protein OF852_02295 [Homoserinibacter sp. YIM 151385]